MKTIFRMTAQFIQDVRLDLARPHSFAAERVGFISIRAANTDNSLILIAENYHPVADSDYIDDPNVGAMIGQEAIRKALDIALMQSVGMFHVHMHEHLGCPWFSRTDLREQLKFIPDFFKVCKQLPHGAIVLSHDIEAGRVWLNHEKISEISEFNIIGSKLKVNVTRSNGKVDYYA